MVVIGQFSRSEEAAEHGLVYSSRDDTLKLFKRIFTEWEPWHQAMIMNQASNLAAFAAGFPGLIVATRLRRLLPGMGRAAGNWIPVPVSMMVPGSLAGMFHYSLITNDIILQETACPVCLETRAISGQVALGVGLSSFSALAGTLVVGNFARFKWMPKSLGGLVIFTKDIVSKTSPILLGLTVVQMLVAGGLVHFQRNSYDSIMEELEKRAEEDKKGVDHRVLGMDRDYGSEGWF